MYQAFNLAAQQFAPVSVHVFLQKSVHAFFASPLAVFMQDHITKGVSSKQRACDCVQQIPHDSERDICRMFSWDKVELAWPAGTFAVRPLSG